MTTEPHLWITPSRRSGDPCIGGLNVRAETVAERASPPSPLGGVGDAPGLADPHPCPVGTTTQGENA